MVFPFQSFHLARGAAQSDFNFASIRQIDVFIDLGYGLPESLQFEMALERVRVGQSVPEPSTISGFLLIAATAHGARFKHLRRGTLADHFHELAQLARYFRDPLDCLPEAI